MPFVFMLCLGLLTHSLFITNISLHHAQCFNLLVFLISCSHRFLMNGLCALWRNST